MEIASAPANGLNERSARTKEAFLIGVEHSNQRYFRQIQSLSQQVNSDEHVVLATPQIAKDFDALKCLDFRMHVAAAHADFAVVLSKVLSHAFCQSRNQHSLFAFCTQSDFM